MHTFLTPEPITVEIRNASGDIRVDLADVTTTTVDVVASSGHPFGFIDDVIRAVASKGQSVGAGRIFGGDRRFDRPSDSYEGGPADDPAERARVDYREPVTGKGGTLIVDTDPARDGWKSSFTVHVTAPASSGIRIQTQSADVDITGRSDRLETRTASGDVRIDEVTGKSLVQTASGDVIVNVTGECDIRTASGDIVVQAVTSEAVVHSTSGDIRLENLTGNTNARSVSGDIRVLDVTSGRAELTTVSGDVEVGIHAGSLAAIDLSTISGSTESDFEVSDEVPVGDQPVGGSSVDDSSFGDSSVSDSFLGDDASAAGPEQAESPVLDLRVKTTSGNIRLRRSAAVG
jgi:hypothetical protein